MNIGAAVLIGALISTLLDLIRYAKAKDANGVATLLAGFTTGVAVIFLASASKVTSTYRFNGIALDNLDWASKVFIGMLATGLFAKVVDITKAIDSSRTSAKPFLVPPPAPAAPQPGAPVIDPQAALPTSPGHPAG